MKPESTNFGQSHLSAEKVIEGPEAVDNFFENPLVTSGTNVEFTFEEREGRELIPGQSMIFKMPKHLQHRVVRDVVLIHRKGEEGRELIQGDWDPHGAYSRVEVHDAEEKEWKQWRDPKGYDPDKFAEPRPVESPEIENLHDWIYTVGQIKTDEVRVTNVGKHPRYSASRIHSLKVILYPDFELLKKAKQAERIYCPGTEFVDLKEKKRLMPRYGGGSHTEGIYEMAIPLNQNPQAPELYKLREDPGEGVEKETQCLTIDLEPQKELLFFEIAIGDAKHLAEPDPKTGRRKRPGGALLWVGIKRAGAEAPEWFMEKINVPPQEVLAGAPLPENARVQEGDKLVIEAHDDPAYIMGWRVTYKD